MAGDTDAKDVVLLEPEGTTVPVVVGTAIKLSKPIAPKSTVTVENTDAKEVVLLEHEGTTAVPVFVGTAIKLSSPNEPTSTVTVEIGKEAYNTPVIYRSQNNKNQVLLRIPMSASLPSFQRNMHRTNFVDNLLKNLGPNTEEATKWLLGHLARTNSKIYEEVAREKGIITTQNKKMDAHSAAAMWEDANVKLFQQRKINRHLGAYFGSRLTVPEKEIKEIGKGNPEVAAAHKEAMEKTKRKRKSNGTSAATKDSSKQKLASDT
jgi:hypothetical protein